MCFMFGGCSSLFQPTPSARRVTTYHTACNFTKEISTHTLRKEGDEHICDFSTSHTYFNPHPPQGG